MNIALDIPQRVAELTEPVPGASPTGEDAARSDDPIAGALYSDLEMALSQFGQVDYAAGAQKAADILRRYGKHLRVAAWLCLCWLRTDGLAGFRDGLLLIKELLTRYGDQLHPAKPIQRSKAIQFLNDPRFRALEKIQPSPADGETVGQISRLLQELDSVCREQFPDQPPDLGNIAALVEKLSRSAPSSSGPPPDASSASAAAPAPTEATATGGNVTGNPSVSTTGGPNTPTSPATEVSPPTEQDATGTPGDVPIVGENDAGPEATPEETKPSPVIPEYPEDVLELLEPVSSDNPAGEDVENHTDQEAVVAYMKLESEISKYSGNDYELCAKWAREILQQRSKHLRVALWLMIAWFRKEKLEGFRNGLMLLIGLLEKFGEGLHPADLIQQARVLQVLNTDQRLRLLKKMEPTKADAQLWVEIGRLFEHLTAECTRRFADSPPRFTVIGKIIEEHATQAQQILQESKAPREPERTDIQAPAPEPPPDSDNGRSREDSSSTASPGRSAAAPTTVIASPPTVALTSEKSARGALKKALLFFFEEEKDGRKIRKVPTHPFVYGLSRSFRWSGLTLPHSKANITQIDGPNPQKQAFIANLVSGQQLDELIPEIEIRFLGDEGFPYWLDAQRYVVQALEKKGGEALAAAEEIKFHLARLLRRLPDLPELMFKDKKTPFASSETVLWLEDEIQPLLRGGDAGESILPPVVDESYRPIHEMYEKACAELPKNFEENARAMQEAIAGDPRPKGRFLRLLNLANYCHAAKRYAVARTLFSQLMEQIDQYHIIEWEQPLCVSVWQSTYLNNVKLLKLDQNSQERAAIEKQQTELLERISRYDCVRALHLSNQKSNKGE